MPYPTAKLRKSFPSKQQRIGSAQIVSDIHAIIDCDILKPSGPTSPICSSEWFEAVYREGNFRQTEIHCAVQGILAVPEIG